MPVITPVIWSPKMIASSINLLGLSDIATGGKAGFYSKLPPKARAYAARQMTEGIGIAVGIMAAAALGGNTVHYDPRDPKFGDVQFGEDENKSFNVFGRYAGMIKLIANLVPGFLGGGRMDKEGKVVSTYDKGGKTGGGVVGGFFRGKMNPVSGLAYDVFLNDNKGFYDRKEITPATAATQLVIPMSLRNVRQQLERDGTISLLNYSLPNFLGVSMKDQRDYTPSTTSEQFDIRDTKNNTIRKSTKEEQDKFKEEYNKVYDKKMQDPNNVSYVTEEGKSENIYFGVGYTKNTDTNEFEFEISIDPNDIKKIKKYEDLTPDEKKKYNEYVKEKSTIEAKNKLGF